VSQQPAASQPTSLPHSKRTLLLIKRARVLRDLIVFVIGVVLAVIGFAVSVPAGDTPEPVWLYGLAIAIGFLIAAFVHTSTEWRRTSSRRFRMIGAIIFLVFGTFLAFYGAGEFGVSAQKGVGTTYDCEYYSTNSRQGGETGYICDANVKWADGSTTHETANLDRDETVTLNFSRSMISGFGQSFVSPGWPTALAHLVSGVLIGLQALFSLIMLTVGWRKASPGVVAQ